MTPNYPETLPGPESLVFRPGVQVQASDENQPGPIAVRRRSRQPTADAAAVFRYLENDYAVFVAWWKGELLYGHRWFLIHLPSANDLVPHVARFANKYRSQARGHRYFEVTCELELRDRQIGVPIILA